MKTGKEKRRTRALTNRERQARKDLYLYPVVGYVDPATVKDSNV